MNQKGYVYTVLSLLLSLVLLAVVSLYYDSYKAAVEVSPAKLRTDELHYFVESAKKDTGRAMYISLRRGAAYLDDYVVNNHTYLTDASAALKQIMANGTITRGASTYDIYYMRNQTLNSFLASLREKGTQMRFRTNISLRTLDVYMYDSLHILAVAKYNFSIADQDNAEGGVCGYENGNQTIYVLVPIDGLEDPLYAYSTTGKVGRVYNRSTQSGILLLGSGVYGKGLGGGMVKDVSSAGAGQDTDIEDYNNSYPWLTPYTVFVINTSTSALAWTSFSDESKRVLNYSGGVIDYYAEELPDAGFPYVSGIPSRINFTDREYVIVKNGNTPKVLYLWMANDIVNKYYANSTNGSCFLDRLEGNGNLTDKYRNQAAEARAILGQPNTATIGIESYVNMSELNASKLYADITPYENYSSVDYLYFQNIPGSRVYGTPYWFRMDAQNFRTKNLTDYCLDNYAAVYLMDEYYTDGQDYTYDSSHNAPDLELTGITSQIATEGKKGNCLEIQNFGDAGEAYVNVSETEYSVSFWFKTYSPCSDCGLFSTDSGDNSENDRNIYLDSGMHLCADVFVSGLDNICTTTVYNDDEWHFVVHTLSNSSGASGRHKLYVDGSLKNTGSYSYSNRTGQARIVIGASPVAATNPTTALIDDVRIWNRALSASEVRQEYEKLL